MAIKTILAGACLALSTWSGSALAADNYPNRTITMVVPAAAGGGTDVLARALAESLSRRLGQSVVVDNKTGASGMLGTQAVARAAPDGYTVLLAYSTPVFYAHHMMAKVPYNIQKDFAVISQIATGNLLMLVNADLPIKNMKDFMAWAQANKGKLSYGSYGPGSAGHLISAYFNDKYKLSMTHVPYKSEAPLHQELAAGVVPWGLGTQAGAKALLSSGRVRPIAVLGPKREAGLPDVPTMAEQGFPEPELMPVAWFSLLAPAGTPQPIVDRLEKETMAAMKAPELQRRLAVLGLEEAADGAEVFRQNFKRVDPIIKKLVEISGAKE